MNAGSANAQDPQDVPVPKDWARRLLRTGHSVDLTIEQRVRITELLSQLHKEGGREAVLFELERMTRKVATLKENAADNVTKTVSIQDLGKNIAIAAVTVLATVMISPNPALRAVVAGVAALAILLLGTAVIIPVITLMPKKKNWTPPCLASEAILDLELAIADGQLQRHYIDEAERQHHWKQLLQLERRALNVTGWLTVAGMGFVVVSAVVAAIAIILVAI